MSDTTEAAKRTLRQESPIIAEVCGRLERSDADSDLLLDFARLFLSRAPEDLLRQRETEDLAAMTLGAFRFLEGSRPYRVDVEVSSPAKEGWEAPVTIIRTNVSERPFIIDSIREYLSLHDFSIERMVYPILDVE
ncbi:MAG: hypothetical protein R3253_17590, partial [Longimicrobiales bacterium]|nr:hypothetical protein [Longimicrobiales bacterium]